jgi:hypothetical protein
MDNTLETDKAVVIQFASPPARPRRIFKRICWAKRGSKLTMTWLFEIESARQMPVL